MWVSLFLLLLLTGFAVVVAGASPWLVACGVLGVGLLGAGVLTRAMGRRCARWPSTDGLVLESRIDATSGARHRPVLRYTYTVEGETFESRRISYAGYSSDPGELSALIAPWPQGQRATVYYDPTFPGRAVLERRMPAGWQRLVGLGLGLLALALALATLP